MTDTIQVEHFRMSIVANPREVTVEKAAREVKETQVEAVTTKEALAAVQMVAVPKVAMVALLVGQETLVEGMEVMEVQV